MYILLKKHINIYYVFIIMDNKYKQLFKKQKSDRREVKRTDKRSVTGEEVIFIFEKILEEWKTIRIFNTIIQSNPNSSVDKKKLDTITFFFALPVGKAKILKIIVIIFYQVPLYFGGSLLTRSRKQKCKYFTRKSKRECFCCNKSNLN
jgi:hypothetical protein